MVHHRSMAAKVIVRRRRRCRPFQRRGFPRIIARLRPLEHAPEQIEHEYKLEPDGDERRIRHELLHRNQIMQIRKFG